MKVEKNSKFYGSFNIEVVKLSGILVVKEFSRCEFYAYDEKA